MNRSVLTTITNMCMIYDDKGNVLVQDRDKKEYPGITFPGGHVEHGESLVESVIREVFEETGLSIENPEICGIKDWINDDGSRYIVLLYKTNKFSGELIPSEEGDVFWTKFEDISEDRLANDMKKMVEIFYNNEVSEFYYYKKDGKWENKLL